MIHLALWIISAVIVGIAAIVALFCLFALLGLAFHGIEVSGRSIKKQKPAVIISVLAVIAFLAFIISR